MNDNASSSTRKRKKRKSFKTLDKGDVAHCGVCKLWRSFALYNKNTFMASKPPMRIFFEHYSDNTMLWCLKDFEGRNFKTIVPDSEGRKCVGCTCGYLILTRGAGLECTVGLLVFSPSISGGLLVFSPSISGWVFVLLHENEWCEGNISFYIAGKRGWNHVYSNHRILDIHVFKGNIYTLDTDFCVRELKLLPNRKHKWTLLEIKNFPKPYMFSTEFVSSSESLYVIDHYAPHKVLEIDIGEMKWVSPEKTIEEYAIFLSNGGIRSSAAIKPESWAGPWTDYKSYDCFLDTNKNRLDIFDFNTIWYFPHDCLNVNLLDK
ncbi:unnamed protein product [Lactuca virosa]|uniref:F-box associated domain-containing protein n=1 Tax=Lactuca virosa TaxID=75947 RepID=A0AAU9PFM8_9ASTR|nr:unnamed protein product [Lactuca virosa]